MRQALRSSLVYAVRDRDFLPTELLGKDVPAGVYSLERHCLESYLLEPAVVEAAFGLRDVEARLFALAERRFWPDVGQAVLDALGYELRKDRPHIEADAPADKTEMTRTLKAKLQAFRDELAAKPLDVEGLVERFEHDLRSAPVWMRVHGKELLKSLATSLGASVPGGDIERELFKWCSNREPPAPLVAEVKRILESLPRS
jgi:hypothetical protein